MLISGEMFRRGFTLIELMIVVVVVGILAAIAIPMYNNATVRAKQAQAKVVLAGIRESLEEWYEEYGGFPEWWDGWPLGYRWHDKYFWFHPIAFRGNKWVFLDYYHPEEDPVYEYTLFIGECPYEGTYASSGFIDFIDHLLNPLPSLANAFWIWSDLSCEDYWVMADPIRSPDKSLRNSERLIITSSGKLFKVPASVIPDKIWSNPAGVNCGD